MIRYATTIFLSAFLLFQVQPLIARVILPWFGGSSSVWTTCLMFFQIVLVGGYLYAHGLRRLFEPRTGWLIHVSLLVLACLNLLLLPLLPGDWLKPSGDENLTIGILTVLGLSVGIPFFVLSTTGPLVQAWQSVTGARETGSNMDQAQSNQNQKSTYRLYAVSNLGSILALLTYPFLFEPNLSLAHQAVLWTVLFVSFCCLCISSGMQLKPNTTWTSEAVETSTQDQGNHASAFRVVIWLLLAMAPSIMLLATTNLMCQQIASVPFLWIVPLSLYLLSFIICFDRPALYQRWLFGPLMVLSVFVGIATVHMHIYVSAPLQILGLCFVCFATSMSCHGELERIKPPTKHLTLFYLCVAIGGSLGGIFVVVVSPLIFSDFYEFQVGLIIVAFLSCLTPLVMAREKKNWHWAYIMAGLFAAAIPLASLMHQIDPSSTDGLVMKGRNEYGLTSVIDHTDVRSFVSGKIDHGTQRHQPDKKFEPSGYYTHSTGIAIALQGQRSLRPTNQKNVNVGVIGLGIGAMLAWCEDDDQFTFYEINPAVEEIAREYFSFLSEYADQTEVVIGDGRIQLEKALRESGPKKFDILAADAFSSDSIPVHLLTIECIKLYQDHLAEEGVLVFHISNRFVDLKPVLKQAADELGMHAIHILNDDQPSDTTEWILMTYSDAFLQNPLVTDVRKPWSPDLKKVRWTDDHASLVPIIDWNLSIDWDSLPASKGKQVAPGELIIDTEAN